MNNGFFVLRRANFKTALGVIIGALFPGDFVYGEVQAGFLVFHRIYRNHVVLWDDGVEYFVRIDGFMEPTNLPEPVEVPPADPPPTLPYWRIRRDDEVEEYGYVSRTAGPNWPLGVSTPAVYRFSPTPVYRPGDYRIRIGEIESFCRVLNGNDPDKFRYWSGIKTAQFNSTGWDKMAYITMSDNLLDGEMQGDYLKFKTLTLSTVQAGMNNNSHPSLIHRFRIVGFRSGSTFLTDNTPQGIIDYPCITKEGFAFIHKRHVIEA